MRTTNRKRRGQMSEAWITAILLSASGGLQDAYTYLTRGKVFANAQTGNVVLLSQGIIAGDPAAAGHYLIPLLAFAAGVAAADIVGHRFKTAKRIHWRQIVLLMEILLLFAVGAGLGGICVRVMGQWTIWISCALLLVCFGILALKDEPEQITT